MKILVVSFYFEPDLSAGSFRNTSLVRGLSKACKKDDLIQVITTLPNRYPSYSTSAKKYEVRGNVTINRVRLPFKSSSLLFQALSYLAFSVRVLLLVRRQRYDLVYASSSRLMTATLGVFIGNTSGTKSFIDIRDNFLETVQEVLPRRLVALLLPVLNMLEAYTFKNATNVNFVSAGFLDYFITRYPNLKFSLIPNGIDEIFFENSFEKPYSKTPGKIRVLYAGNFGDGQGLEHIVPHLARHYASTIEFILIGDGSRKKELERLVSRLKLKNVFLKPPVSQKALLAEYAQADVLFAHLNSQQAFLNVIPSKLFEYGATGKPLWLGIGGFSAAFFSNELENIGIFEPCDINAAIVAFNRLNLKMTKNEEFREKYRRSNLTKQLASQILGQIG